jgi:hypothetical protein
MTRGNRFGRTEVTARGESSPWQIPFFRDLYVRGDWYDHPESTRADTGYFRPVSGSDYLIFSFWQQEFPEKRQEMMTFEQFSRRKMR